jgi:two-component system, NarL family, response regulator LiaR
MILRLRYIFALLSAVRGGGRTDTTVVRASGAALKGAPMGFQVALIDGHDSFRRRLRNLLGEYGIDVVAESSSTAAGAQEARERKPDLIVVDPESRFTTAKKQIAELSAVAPVLVLTNIATEESVVEAMVAGASGYVLKEAPIEQLVSSIAAAAAGGAPMSPEVAPALLAPLRARAADAAAAATIERQLSERELDVLKLLAEGKGNIEIAEMLLISPKTVQHHVSNILEKLGAENRIQAAVYAARSGIV